MKKIITYHFEDTAEIRSFLLCQAIKKNVYSPEMGYKADRLQLILKERAKQDCKLEFIEECANKSNDVNPADVMVYNIMQCIIRDMKDNCRKV